MTYHPPKVHFELRGDASATMFDGVISGNTFRGDVRDGAAVSILALVRNTELRSAAFREEDAHFKSGDVALTGTFLVPHGATDVPAVVMLHGSGPEERSANRYLAEHLASHGVAALIYDKRGTGESSGDWKTSSFADLAADAKAGVDWVRQRGGVNSHVVGIFGHSQGAMIGPMIASRANNIAFFVASAAAGVPLEEVERYSVANALGVRHLSQADVREAKQYVRALVHTAYTGQGRARLDSLVRADSAKPWFEPPPASDNYYWTFSRSVAAFNPLRYWKRVDVPVLLTYGQRDERVPVAPSIAGIRNALRRAGSRACRLRVFSSADHSMRIASRAGESFRWPQNAD
ncbi:MAG TPA: alpha/beta fold hydrolase, partial [Gemmatimonadaceae bacterium]|nr:alpha/beta fold hydrolase [Gemmatimonadaceae bacterium]